MLMTVVVCVRETPTDDLDCMQLRNMFFEKAEFAENNLEAKVGGKK